MPTSLIKQHIGNNSDLVCFCWHFYRKYSYFPWFGISCVTGHWMHSCKLKPFCDKRPQITRSQYINAEHVQTHMTFSFISHTRTFRSRTTEQKWVEGSSIFINTYHNQHVRVNDVNNGFPGRLCHCYVLLMRSYCTHSLVDCTNT